MSEIGVIADKYWLIIPEHFTFVKLNVHVVMPNHVHGIIVIDKPDEERNVIKNDERNVDRQVETPKLGVSTMQSLHQSQTSAASQKWKSETLGTIINQYKRICTIESRKKKSGFRLAISIPRPYYSRRY